MEMNMVVGNKYYHVFCHFQVITRKVKGNVKLLQHLCEACSQHVQDKNVVQSDVHALMSMFMRKYTHARIQGFIKGESERKAEKDGHRIKGGSNFRDKLYHISSGNTNKSPNRMAVAGRMAPVASCGKSVAK